MNDKVKYIIKKSFYKSLPRGKEEYIINKVEKFIDNQYNIYNKTGIWSYSTSSKKIKGRDSILKFKINDSDRVLFTNSSNIEEFNFYRENYIVILEYCNHDEQIRRAKNICLRNNDYQMLDIIKNMDLDDIIDYNYKIDNYTYLLDDDSLIEIHEDEKIIKLINSDFRNAIYYLNAEQRECVDENNLPLLIMGSAGSGKTTVGINKIYRLMNIDNNKIAGYFTYSKILKEETKSQYKYLCDKKNNNHHDFTSVEFYDTDDIAINKKFYNDLKHSNYIKYNEFKEWYNDEYIKINFKVKINFKSFEVWRDIRGIIKGMIGIDWAPNKMYDNVDDNSLDIIISQKKMLSETEYLNLSNDYSIFEQTHRCAIYHICKKYQKWLEKNNKFDDNDIARQTLYNICIGKINKYDYILVDEVQDLTEKQIYTLFKMNKSKDKIIFSGDYNQTITATYFDTRRIVSLIKYRYNLKNFKIKTLRNNYRNCKDIVNLANKVTQLRIEKLGKDKRNDYFEIAKQDHNGYKPFYLFYNKTNEEKLLNSALNRHYVAIVVANEDEKSKLIKEKNIISGVFTVSEIKGIEKRYIICYNLISNFKDIWELILGDNLITENYIYRYYFNLIYVAITRATENICFFEENMCGIYDVFKEYIEYIEEYDEYILNLSEISDNKEHYNEGIRLEKKGLFKHAIEEYNKSDLIESKTAIDRCEAFILKKSGDYIKSGEKLFDIEEYNLALECFSLTRDKSNILKCLIMISDSYNSILNYSNEYNINPVHIFFNNTNMNLKNVNWENKFLNLYIKDVEEKIKIYNNLIQDVNNLMLDVNDITNRGNI